MKKVIVTGATGFIGGELTKRLILLGYHVVALTREPDRFKINSHPQVTYAKWSGVDPAPWQEHVDGAYAIVNLVGQNIGAGRWTTSQKEKIVQSRLDAGKAVTEAVRFASIKPKVLIQGSGIGFYGNSGDMEVDESAPGGVGFLADLAEKWEASSIGVTEHGVRYVAIRTGAVLGKGGGALDKMALPYKLFVGGPVGNGNQWFPWIHLEDEVNSIIFLMENEALSGPVNLTAPNPVKQKNFSKALGKALKRPALLPTPGFVLKAALGEMATELLLSGQRSKAGKLINAGFEFKFPDISKALSDIY